MRRHRTVALAVESLEDRRLLSVAPATPRAAELPVGRVSDDFISFSISENVDALGPLAEATGRDASALFGRGIRQVVWHGEARFAHAGEWLVGLPGDPRAGVDRLSAAFAGLPGTTVSYLGGAQSYLIRSSDATGYVAVSAALAGVPDVLFVEPNFAIGAPQADAIPQAVPNDPSYYAQWDYDRIQAPAAWDATTGSNDIVVGIIDTGVDINHPDLAANVWVNPFEIPDNGIDDDGNGYVDDVRGWNFGNDTNLPDAEGHGTHVAGTVGAVGDNGVGVTGVNWRVKLIGLDVFADGTTNSATVISALSYLADLKSRGVNVVASNNSYGSLGNSAALSAALVEQAAANILFVAAAGNDGVDVTTPGFWPATNGSANTIAVASSNSTDGKSGFSNWSATRIHIAAPGESIYSTVPGGYDYSSGSSMASPHVTGLVALAYSVVPDASYWQIRQAIFDGGDPVDWSATPTITNKRINANNTVTLARTHVAGTLFLDADADSIFDGNESVLTGWNVYDDANDNGVRDSTEAYAAVQANGKYAILLAPGTHLLRVEVASGYTRTLGSAGHSVALASGQSLAGYDFGAHKNGAQLSGTVYRDFDQDGVRDVGEPGVSDAVVYLDRNDNGQIDQDIVRTYNGAGASITSSRSFTRTATSTVATAGLGRVVDVDIRVNISKSNVSSLSIALESPAGTSVSLIPTLTGSNLTNTVFDDSASDSISSGSAPFTGTFRPLTPLSTLVGENASGSWRLKVTNAANGGTGSLVNWSLILQTDDDEPIAYTNTDGSYRFTALAAGTYLVRERPPYGWFQIAPANDGGRSATVATNQVVSNLDFAIFQREIVGSIWEDRGANGVRDPDDPGLAGWTVYADIDGSGGLTAGDSQTVSASDGSYVLVGLPASAVPVRVAAPVGWSASVPLSLAATVDLAAAPTGEVQFGLFRDGSISGTVRRYVDADQVDIAPLSDVMVFIDFNADGDRDVGEPSAVSDSLGRYAFADLAPASYVVRAEPPASYEFAVPSSGSLTAAIVSGTESSGNDLTFVRIPPVVTGVAPFVGPTTGFTVTITGTGFADAYQVAFGSAVVPIPPNASDTTIVVAAPAGALGSVDVVVANPGGESHPFAATPGVDQITYRAAKLDAVVVGDGTAQRSSVRSIALNFDGLIDSAPAAAFSITDLGDNPIAGLTVGVAGVGGSVLTLTFTDDNADGVGPVVYGSLGDGRYRLTVDGSLLQSGGAAVDADADGLAGGLASADFSRLFGDADGNGFVDATDLYPFLVNSIDKGVGDPGYMGAFDFDGNGFVDATDIYPEIVNRIDAGL